MSDRNPLARFAAGGSGLRVLLVGAPPPGLALALPPEPAAQVDVALAPGHPGDLVAAPARLPFVEALFDRIAFAGLLADPRAELRELWRVLAPAGLVLFVVPAKRPWQRRPGWRESPLKAALHDAMFEWLAGDIAALPARHHVILAGKRDGLSPIVLTAAAEPTATPALAANPSPFQPREEPR
ncbi:hypothetical protein IP88_01330 [alpha proteobacterium AAP81b]|nr:hypothetical protein IP88_01330 [alpha proteobacterium AAP81b]